MGNISAHSNGFLARLLHNQAGNTLAIVAAAVIPLIGVIGGGIDVSRVYLSRARAQQACDSGALAGRKSMSGITWATANETMAKQFFNTNFTDNKYGTGAKTIAYTASSSGAVTGTATVVVPMTLMSVFSMPDKTITVTCTADLQLPNTDVMFVLDTTLSMNDTNVGDSKSKIAILRDSVKSFYDQLEAVKSAGASIRYGFVPYSSTVNVGMLLQRDWIVDNATYDSRVPDGTTPKDGGTQGATITTNSPTTITGSYAATTAPGTAEKCQAPANENYTDTTTYTAWSPSSTALPRSRVQTRVRNGTAYSASLSNGVCTITKTVFNQYTETLTSTISANPNAGQENADGLNYFWRYRPVSYPMAALKGGTGTALVTGGSFVAPVANNHANRTITWNAAVACIEERPTRRTDESTSVVRFDMDVDLVPDPARPETQWRPYLPGLVYGRNSNSLTATTGWVYSGSAESASTTTNYTTPSGSTYEYAACPSPARKMGTITSAQLTTYLNALIPKGYTYHDIGFVWGLRLLSRDGLFATENRAAEVTGKVARNLIFMTDGDTDTRIGVYDAWGQSAVARRRTPIGAIPTNTQQNTITENRLTELCTLARNDKNITVWVIAFGTTLTPLLSDCASPGRSYQANNAAQLATTFSQIVSQIAQLRITS